MTKIGRKLKKSKRKVVSQVDQLLKKAENFYQEQNWKSADAVCRDILRRDPTNHQALYLLGMSLTHQPNYIEAEKYINKAIRIKDDKPSYYDDLGTVLMEQQKWDEALVAFEKACELNPHSELPYYNLGVLHQSIKNNEKAIGYFRKTLSINPNHAFAASFLCKLLSRQPERREELDKIIKHMESIVSNPKCTFPADIYFELARVHDEFGDYEKVFDFLESANKICRSKFEYNVDDDIHYFQEITQNFTKNLFKRMEGSGSDDPAPIFILGMPRSGTTLVEQILGSHSQVAAGGELYYLSYLIQQCSYLKTPYKPNTLSYPIYSRIALVSDAELKKLAQAYIKGIAPLKKNRKHVTDKMPHNFIHIGMIHLFFPNSRVIHCRRASMDNCLSLYMHNFKGFHPYLYSQKELARYYVGYSRLMDHWRTLLPGFIYEINYEELVNRPERETRKLLEFCNLEWEKNCLEFYKLDRFINTASEGQADQPIYTTSIDRWKRYKKELQPMYKILKQAGLLEKSEE